jgi:hypothetical protein
MLGMGGVDYALSGGITESQATFEDALASFLFGQFESAADEGFSVDAAGVGTGQLVIAAPSGALAEIPVAIVDASAVATITLTATLPVAVGNSQPVTAHALTSDERTIESPACGWTLTPTSGAPEIVSEGRESAYVLAQTPAAATIRCGIGAAAGELALTFE